MFRLDNILERWAELYQPLQHNKDAHPTFFRISMIDDNSYFVRNYSKMEGACMAYATHIDAEMAKQNSKSVSYRHVIYFLVKQTPGTLSKTTITDEEGATEARFKCDDMVQDLIAVLRVMKGCAGGKSVPPELTSDDAADMREFIEATAADADYREGLRGLELDGAHWGTLPVKYNGWQVCGLTIEQVTPRLLCVKMEKYVKG